jgi:hypothetical protein
MNRVFDDAHQQLKAIGTDIRPAAQDMERAEVE